MLEDTPRLEEQQADSEFAVGEILLRVVHVVVVEDVDEVVEDMGTCDPAGDEGE